MQSITIQHQTEKTYHTFKVANPDKLTAMEVLTICGEMNVTAILINGRFYEAKL